MTVADVPQSNVGDIDVYNRFLLLSSFTREEAIKKNETSNGMVFIRNTDGVYFSTCFSASASDILSFSLSPFACFLRRIRAKKKNKIVYLSTLCICTHSIIKPSPKITF